jgi:nitrogen regulatory protein PII
MRKVEIIFDESLTKEFLLILKQSTIEYYTLIESVKGVGRSGARYGNATAPGKNSMLIVIAEMKKVEVLIHSIRRFKENHPNLGIKAMVFPIQEII